MERPRPLTILAWTTIVFGVFSLAGVLAVTDPAAREISEMMGIGMRWQIWSSVFGGIVLSTAGTGLLRARAWARSLLVVYFIVSLIASFVMLGDLLLVMLVPTSVLYLVALAILYHPTTSDYLDGVYQPDRAFSEALYRYRRLEGSNSDLVRVFAVLILVAAGFMLSVVVVMDALLASLPGRGIILTVMMVPLSVAVLTGVLMWGWRRWMMALGWVLAGGGAAGVFQATVMWSVAESGWMEMLALEAGELPPVSMGSALFAGGLAILGAALLLIRIRRDRVMVTLQAA